MRADRSRASLRVVLAASLGIGGSAAPVAALPGTLTCPDHDRPHCTAPGGLRWSLDLDDPYVLTSGGSKMRPARWSPEGDRPIVVASAGSVVYIANDVVRILDRSTGRLRWRVRVGGDLRGPKTIPDYPEAVAGDGLVAVPMGGEDERAVHVLDLASGRRLKRLRLPERGQERLTGIIGGRLILSDEGTTTAIGVRDGTKSWSRNDSCEPAAETLWCVGGGSLHRADQRTGRPSLSRRAGGDWYLARDQAPGVILVATSTGVLAIDSANGRRLWEKRGDIEAVDRLARPRVVYVRDGRRGPAKAFDARSGERMSGWPEDEAFDNTNHVARATTVVPTLDRRSVNGLDVTSGGIRWNGPIFQVFEAVAFLDDRDPALVVGLACADGGIRASRLDEGTDRDRCDRPRLVAVNW